MVHYGIGTLWDICAMPYGICQMRLYCNDRIDAPLAKCHLIPCPHGEVRDVCCGRFKENVLTDSTVYTDLWNVL